MTGFAQPPLPSALSREKIWLCVFGALAFSLALDRELFVAVWRENLFRDTDDAMRMVEVRDFLAGQGWFDLTVHGFAPPAEIISHWSRLIDAPIAALVRLFALMLAPAQAERAARLAFPLLSLAALYRISVYAARIFAGEALALAGPAACALTGVAAWQFAPGRIDHHGAQIALLLLAASATAEAFDPARARAAALAGAALALCLGIGLENLPFFAVLTLGLGGFWVVSGATAAPALRHFALGLSLSLIAVYGATIAPARWRICAPDALSFGHLAALLALSAGFLALSRLHIAALSRRLAAALVAGGATIAATLALAPEAARPPFDGLDPVLREFWLSHVAEMQSFWAFTAGQPVQRLSFVLPFLLALLGAGIFAAQSKGVGRARALLLLALLALGGALSLIQIRCASSTAPLMAIGGLTLVARLRAIFATPARTIAAIFLSSRLGVALLAALALPAQDEKTVASALARSGACFAPKAYDALARLPEGAAIAQIDVGPFLLAFTGRRIFAAPYHRANIGDRLALDVLTGDISRAEALARQSGARWIFFCAAPEPLRAAYVARNAQGLAARLVDGETPAWLHKTAVADTPFLAFEILPASDKRQD